MSRIHYGSWITWVDSKDSQNREQKDPIRGQKICEAHDFKIEENLCREKPSDISRWGSVSGKHSKAEEILTDKVQKTEQPIRNR